MKIKINKLVTLLSIASTGLMLSAGHNLTLTHKANATEISATKDIRTQTLGIKNYKLESLDFISGNQAIIELNNNHANLNPNDWQEHKIVYKRIDQFNRATGAKTAFLSKSNIDSLSKGRVKQYINPSGWHPNLPDQQIYNRGHFIAYSLSKGIDKMGKYSPNLQRGDQNNRKNLFTQTDFSNKALQTIFEDKVRTALMQDKKVIYQAKPIFRGSELMARGVHLQAISTDKSLNFNVYIFNVQPGYKFDYQTGRVAADKDMYVSFNNQKFNNFDYYHAKVKQPNDQTFIHKISQSKIYIFFKEKLNALLQYN